MADVDQVIDEIEASYAPGQQVQAEEIPARGRAGRILPALAAGVVLGGLVAAVVMVFGLGFRPYGHAAATLLRQYNEAAPLIPAAVDYMHEVADAVAKMQKSDPAALEAKSSRFISVAALDPQLWKKLPRAMPARSNVIVEADKNNYKILFGWPLCAAARIAMPEMVNPVSCGADVLGCPFFGLWTQGAAKW
jgi:hypothetical protein